MLKLRNWHISLSMFTVVLFSLGCALAVWAYSREANINLRNSELLARQRLVQSQIASCERVNILRRQFNERGVAIAHYAQAKIRFDEAMIESPDSHSIERVIARREIVALLELNAAFRKIPIVDCTKVVTESTARI